jgi:cathepsin D
VGLTSSYEAQLTADSVILDTGSSDTWLADSDCSVSDGCPSNVAAYSIPTSTTADVSSTSFRVNYGSGSATGLLVRDTVELAGYSVSNQVVAAVNATTGGLLTAPVSGLMGLGFQPIAASRATPWWQNAGIREFGFALTRFVNDTSARVLEPGGVMVVNGVNTSLFSASRWLCT